MKNKFRKHKQLCHIIRTACLTGALIAYGAGAYAEVMTNITLPTGGKLIGGTANGINSSANNIMNITNVSNAVIQWNDFSIGSIATVNFTGEADFNVLNYVNSGKMSQIHGTMNAPGGNVYLVNTAGVFIGKSAQIDVGSLHVSNKKIADLEEENITLGDSPDINSLFNNGAPASAAELMSLGHINATKVEFIGDRIVLDTAHLTNGTDTPIGANNINIKTTDKDNVVLGYEAYTETNQYKELDENNNPDGIDFTLNLAKVNDEDFTKKDGYMWVEDVEQLQAIESNLSGNYALRNGIDATNTAENDFIAIGTTANPFTGKLDGLADNKVEGVDFSIFDLHVSKNNETDTNTSQNIGLFGVTAGTTLRNLTFVSGSAEGSNNVGILAGTTKSRIDNDGNTIATTIENIKNSANVKGTGTNSANIGGIIGRAEDDTIIKNMVNTGAVSGNSSVGGIVGSMEGGSLDNAQNLGQIRGTAAENTVNNSHDIGGIVGSAQNAALSNVENILTVAGGYNVGGIVGSLSSDSTKTASIENAVNSGSVTAEGYDTNGTYTYHTNDTQDNLDTRANGTTLNTTYNTASISVYEANAGGIVGSSSGAALSSVNLSGVTNTGNIKTSQESSSETVNNVSQTYDYYIAGNVGGIVGSAENTDITDATNKENEVFGAHNVGGIAGYFNGGTITTATNNGGEIKSTGARNDGGFVKESIREKYDESVIIGNTGGIVGYMYGDNSYITGAGNRGTVHAEDVRIDANGNDIVLSINQTANVGGIVGKIDRSQINSLEAIKGTSETAAVTDSYNTGDVRGYTGIGGVAGMMYNGAIADSYNLGYLRSTFQGGDIAALNMGGIVGDTTEEGNSQAVLYNVFNKGQIGDDAFIYYGRHVGGIAGRLTGDIEKAYNTGAIYNASVANGGIAGWWYKGTIKNVFNTGNMTVVNRTKETARVGGIVGAVENTGAKKELSYAYNLGTLRSFSSYEVWYSGSDRITASNSLGGIVGGQSGTRGTTDTGISLSIDNVYTVGNLYSGKVTFENDNYANDFTFEESKTDAHAILGEGKSNTNSFHHWQVTNAFYITPADNLLFNKITSNLDGATSIDYNDKFTQDKYKDTDSDKGFTFYNDVSNNQDSLSGWRIYADSTTPILNAFIPNLAANESAWKNNQADNITRVQYGTAYNPLLTIVNMKDNADLTLNWANLSVTKGGGLAVYGGGLNIENFANATSNSYYGGILYADGALTIGSKDDTAIRLGSASELYGSSVTINNVGNVISYGSITATAKEDVFQKDDADNDVLDDNTNKINISGNIDITGANVEIIGKLTSLTTNETLIVNGIEKSPASGTYTVTDIQNPSAKLADVAEKYAYAVGTAQHSGNIKLTATEGDLQVLYGQQQNGKITTGGKLEMISNNGNVYADADLDVADDISLTAKGEALLDISNNSNMLGFMTQYKDGEDSKLTLTSTDGGDTIVAVDMWQNGAYDFTKYNNTSNPSAPTFLNLYNNFQQKDNMHLWVSDAEQLQGIQKYYNDSKNTNTAILTANFALKNNIDANSIEDYTPIGSNGGNDDPTAFTGTFNGRSNNIIGLKVSNTNSESNTKDYIGIFSKVGTRTDTDNEGKQIVGTVKNLGIISSEFTGSSVGAVAGVNEGKIDNITTFGNLVTSSGHVEDYTFSNSETDTVGAAGGIAGINKGGVISNISAQDTVIAGSTSTNDIHSFAGGIAGVNSQSGYIHDSIANTAVSAQAENVQGVGGIVGINHGSGTDNSIETEDGEGKNISASTLFAVESLGIINGSYKTANNTVNLANDIGGIAGINLNGAVINYAYNEAHISGGSAVGGVVGYSGIDPTIDTDTTTINNNTIKNSVNAGTVISVSANANNTGGLVGNNLYTIISNARNTGTITGAENVGGMVGTNGAIKDGDELVSNLINVTNTGSARITGETNVGGIAGVNYGKIDAEESGLVNDGTIHGQTNVGGVAGENNGEIVKTISNITLYVKDSNEDANYFGGVAGANHGTITNATNTGNIYAYGATYVGGIAGINGITAKDYDTGTTTYSAGNAKLEGAYNTNTGAVIGKDYVGGIAGLNAGEVIGTNEDPSTIRNDGFVWAQDGGAGGIYAENHADLTNRNYINNGTVIGQYEKADPDNTKVQATGGVIGVNYGTISNSNLINTTDALVVGTENVGGLVGINYGSIEGNRDTTDTYYKYQVYNNGTVTGVEFSENEADGGTKINAPSDPEATWYYKESANSTNIGGLIGSNSVDDTNPDKVKTGSLTAAYNTGTVSGGTNVGGVAGSNTGTIDQVFNASDVTAIAQDRIAGGVVGKNDQTATLTNAYTLTGDYAVGNTQTTNDNVTTTGDVWKTYGKGEAYGTEKLLKVFLTKAVFEQTGDPIVYDGQANNFSVGKQLISDGDNNPYVEVYRNDSLIGKLYVNAGDNAEHSLLDYINTINNDGTQLIAGTTNSKNAGTYEILTSAQINTAAGDKAPNNLGFDFVTLKADGTYTETPATVTTEKAELTLTLNDIYRIYGDAGMYSDDKYTNQQSDYEKYVTIDGLKGTDAVTTIEKSFDGAVDNSNGKITNNATDHDWSIKITDASTLFNNYTIAGADYDNTTETLTVTATGKSHVAKADLNIEAGNSSIFLGETPTYTGTIDGNGVQQDKNPVNGDSWSDLGFDLGFDGFPLFNVSDKTNESTTGTHNGVIGVTINGKVYTSGSTVDLANYNLTITPGTLTVTKKDTPTPPVDPVDPNPPVGPVDPVDPNPPVGPNPPVDPAHPALDPNNPESYWQSEDRYPWLKWNKQRSQRERKAEVSFVKGGMEI